MSGFPNPGSPGGGYTYDSPVWGPDQVAYGGANDPNGFGHGHYNPSNGFNRPPAGDLLGHIALQGVFGQKGGGLG